MLPHKVFLMNTKNDTELLVASFADLDEAHDYGRDQVQIAQWSSPRLWHTYRIETEE